MKTKVQQAVNHLNEILPLAERKQQLSENTADIYQKILRSYVELGRSLNKAEIAELTDNVDEVIETLRSNDMVVFDNNGEPIGAYPFTMEKRKHRVKVNNFPVHSMCALDALAISPMFNTKTRIESSCHVSGDTILIEQLDQHVLNKEKNENVFFGISWNSAANNCCATSLCTEMIFLKDKAIAEQWLSEDQKSREIFNLDDAIVFASKFFQPLLK